MEISNKDVIHLMERNGMILFSLLQCLEDQGIVTGNDFLKYCNLLNMDNYCKEFFRNEDDTRSVNDNLHPGGIKATIELCDMAKIDKSSMVLDVGTGHGGAARVIAENYGCKVTGTDTDYIRILNAVFRTKVLGLGHLVDYVLDDAYNMKFCGDTFDSIVRQHSVYGGVEEKFISECYRVLKPGGVIAFHGILKNVSLGGKKLKMEDYSIEEYTSLLKDKGFKIISKETENSTNQLLESIRNINPSMSGMIRKKLVSGIKIIAQKEDVEI